MSSGKLTSGSGKFVLSFVRTFPELVMALLFIKAVGPGSFAGVLALGLHSIGMLGKLYSEGIENIDKGMSGSVTSNRSKPFSNTLVCSVTTSVTGFSIVYVIQI